MTDTLEPIQRSGLSRKEIITRFAPAYRWSVLTTLLMHSSGLRYHSRVIYNQQRWRWRTLLGYKVLRSLKQKMSNYGSRHFTIFLRCGNVDPEWINLVFLRNLKSIRFVWIDYRPWAKLSWGWVRVGSHNTLPIRVQGQRTRVFSRILWCWGFSISSPW